MSGKRIQAVDFFRGLVLLFIVVDHMPGNPLGKVTMRHWSLADATEAFVFISGFTAAMVQLRLIAREGRLVAAGRMLRRSARIHLAFVATALALCALIAGAAALDLEQQAVWTGFGAALVAEPLRFALGVVAMVIQPGLVNVLPLYVLLMLAAPLIVWGLEAVPLTTLAASLALWWTAPGLNALLPSDRPEGYLFNPFAWQGIFVLGALFGVHGRALLERLDRGAWALTPVALAIALAAAFLAPVWEVPSVAPDSVFAGLVKAIYPIDKWNLDPVRVASFLALAWLARRLTLWIAMPWDGPALAWLSLIGRHGLPCFALGTVISLAGDIIARNPGLPGADYVAALVAALLLWATALASAYWDRRALAARPPPTAPSTAAAGTLSPIRH